MGKFDQRHVGVLAEKLVGEDKGSIGAGIASGYQSDQFWRSKFNQERVWYLGPIHSDASSRTSD